MILFFWPKGRLIRRRHEIAADPVHLVSKYRLSVLVMAALATASLAYYYNQKEEIKAIGESFRHEYRLESFSLMQTDDAGGVSFRLNAPSLWKEPGQGKATIGKPQMAFFARSGNAWEADAASALISEDGTLVEMRGLTHLNRLASGNVPALFIEAQSLTVFPNQRLAQTNGPVIIEQQKTKITGVGLRIDMEKESYEVLSQVRIVESSL